ncbi:MAG: hypothetical protein QMD53_06480, partial [Actinomycetota bacterium]|nr:hypothetical protein [Actinomycetota bacterium]
YFPLVNEQGGSDVESFQQAGTYLFVIVVLVSAILNAAYYLPIIYAAFFKVPSDEDIKKDEAHWMMLYPCIFCAVCIILLGTFGVFITGYISNIF